MAQIGEMQRIQQENANIQLFDKRYESYYTLRKWYRATKQSFDKEMKNEITGDILPPKKAFCCLLYGFYELSSPDGQDTLYVSIYDYIGVLSDYVCAGCQKNQCVDDKPARITGTLNQLRADYAKLEVIQHIFADIQLNVVTDFTTAFFDMAEYMSDDNLASLEKNYKTLDESDAMAKMEEFLRL